MMLYIQHFFVELSSISSIENDRRFQEEHQIHNPIQNHKL